MSKWIVAIAVVCGLALAACGSHQASQLKPYAKAVLSPGEGLGDIRLGAPLKAFVERFGSGRLSVVAGDELLAADLHFPGQALGFRFVADEDCRAALRASGSSVQALMGLRDTQRFFAGYPACASMSLQSIGVESGGGMFGPAFSGKTARGTQIGMTRAELFEREGAWVPPVQVSTVLDGPDDDAYERMMFLDGLLAYVQRSGGTTNGPPADSWKVVKLAVVQRVR